MMMMRNFFLIIGVGVLLSGCSATEVTPSVEKMKTPEGQWSSEIAPDYPMIVSRVKDDLFSVSWELTMDSDISIEGVLADKGDGVFSGIVKFSAGDEDGKRPLTLRFDPAGPTLSLELETMWEYPITFNPAGPPKPSCAKVAEDILAGSPQLQSYNVQVKLMNEGDVGDLHDFRLFYELPEGETRTLDRYRVDLGRKRLMRYDPGEGEFLDIEGSESLFGEIDCSKAGL